MRKTAFLISLLACGSMLAQNVELIGSDDLYRNYGGLQIFAMSNSGRYVAGSTMAMTPFIYDTLEGTAVVFTENFGSSSALGGGELRFISDEGVAVGYDDNGAIRCSASGTYDVVEAVGDAVNIAICESMTADGSVIVGSVADGSWNQSPCYWEGGRRVLLPAPTTEEAGFRVNGCKALSVSADGSVIMGQIVDRYQSLPLILWTRQEDGSYAMVKAWEPYFEPLYQPIYDDKGIQTGVERGDNPYITFQPGAMSADGKSIAMYLEPNTGDFHPPILMGIYDVASASLELRSGINSGVVADLEGAFIIKGIADNRTVFGTAGALAIGTQPFIYYPDDIAPLSLAQAFPESEELRELEENMMQGMPYIGSAISADGSCLAGYTIVVYEGNLAGQGFIVRTEEQENGVTAVEAAQQGDAEYFGIDGLRLDAPRRGLNIVRVPGEPARKVFIP